MKIFTEFFNKAIAEPFESCLEYRSESVARTTALVHTLRLAKQMYNQGVRPGDLVAVKHRDTPFLVFQILALLRLGAIYVPCTNLQETILALKQYRCKFVISDTTELIPGIITLHLDSNVDEVANVNFIDYIPADTAPICVIRNRDINDRPSGIFYNNLSLYDKVKQISYDKNFESFSKITISSLTYIFIMNAIVSGDKLRLPINFTSITSNV